MDHEQNRSGAHDFSHAHIVKNSDFGLVRAKSIPDKMTSPDEEAAEFWKVWEKPWFKNSKAKRSSDDESNRFFELRDQAIDQALAFQGKGISKVAESQSKEKIGTSKSSSIVKRVTKSASAEPRVHSEPVKDTLASPLPPKPA